MKKRTFVLLELFIAIALVSLVSPPLVRGIALYLNKQKEALLQLEKERRVEELFYQVCENLNENHVLEKISQKSVNATYPERPKPITFDLGSLGKEKLFWHYHLYTKCKVGSLRKLRFKICFLKHPQAKCGVADAFKKAEYGFILAGEKGKG